MTEPSQHPITPPPELVREWNHACDGIRFPPYGYSEYVATQAARWGADQELESCVTEVSLWGSKGLAERLRAHRRPKPSLAERAVHILGSHGGLSCEEHALLSRILREHIHV